MRGHGVRRITNTRIWSAVGFAAVRVPVGAAAAHWSLRRAGFAFLKVYMDLGSYFLFLQEQIKDVIIMGESRLQVAAMTPEEVVPSTPEPGRKRETWCGWGVRATVSHWCVCVSVCVRLCTRLRVQMCTFAFQGQRVCCPGAFSDASRRFQAATRRPGAFSDVSLPESAGTRRILQRIAAVPAKHGSAVALVTVSSLVRSSHVFLLKFSAPRIWFQGVLVGKHTLSHCCALAGIDRMGIDRILSIPKWTEMRANIMSDIANSRSSFESHTGENTKNQEARGTSAMTLADSFPATCAPTYEESEAIAYLRVDKRGAFHFVEVAWHKNTQHYLYSATAACARRLQNVIRSVNHAHDKGQCWSGNVPGLGEVSLGKMIARDKKHDLIQLTPSQRDEYYALDEQIQIATPIKGRATNQELENLHTDDAVATRPLPTANCLDFMADDDTYNDDQTLPLSARKDPAPRASPRVSDYLSDSEGVSTLEEIANTQIINRSQTLSAASTQPSTAQADAEPGPPADASAGYGRQSLDDGTSQSDRQEACSSQSIHGERVNSQKVSPAAEDKGKGKAEEGQDTYGEGGSSGRGGGRGEGKCRHGEQRGECRECRGEGEAAGGEGRGSQASRGVDSVSDSDDEDPGVKWRRNMDARWEKRKSERERRESEERAREARTTPARASSVLDCNTGTGSGSANDDAGSHPSSPLHRGRPKQNQRSLSLRDSPR